MEITTETVLRVLKQQIAKTQQNLKEVGYDDTPVRERVVALANWYGNPILDVGTGACACMAVALARKGMAVTAVDRASSAVRIAQERVAGELADLLEVRHAEAARLPFPDGSSRTVVAFDALCHTNDPETIVAEMFRVCANGGAVIVTELNSAGRQITHHHDGGFEKKLSNLLAPYCQDCQQVHDTHHVTFICERI